MPLSDRDIGYDTILLAKIRFSDGFQMGGALPSIGSTAGGISVPGHFAPAGPDPRDGTPLEGGPIKVGGVASGAAWLKVSGPGAYTGQKYVTPDGSALLVGLLRTASAGRASGFPDLPAFPVVEGYLTSVPCNTDVQYSQIKLRAKNHATLSYWAALAICSGDSDAGVYYYLAVNSIADASEFTAEWHVGYVIAGVATALSAPVAFQSKAALSAEFAQDEFPISLNVEPDGGTGVDLKVRGFDHGPSTPFLTTVNDAVPAHASLLTGKQVGFGGTALAGTIGPVEISTWWNGGDL